MIYDDDGDGDNIDSLNYKVMFHLQSGIKLSIDFFVLTLLHYNLFLSKYCLVWM